MPMQAIATAIRRAQAILRRRPQTGLHDDAMAAASAGIELAMLEVQASSRSDTRELLGMTDAQGAPVSAGPRDLKLQVRIPAPDVAPERLRALVEDGCRCSPVHIAVQNVLPVTLRIDVEAR